MALANLVYRVEAGDLPFFVTAITIQRETGGNLAEVLEKLGTLIRDRFALYGKVRALTAIGKASANLLASMPARAGRAALHLRRRGRPILRGAAIHHAGGDDSGGVCAGIWSWSATSCAGAWRRSRSRGSDGARARADLRCRS